MFKRIRNILIVLILLYLIGWYFQLEYVQIINMQIGEWLRSKD